jgi:ATP-dependent RNA helicase RhlE
LTDHTNRFSRPDSANRGAPSGENRRPHFRNKRSDVPRNDRRPDENIRFAAMRDEAREETPAAPRNPPVDASAFEALGLSAPLVKALSVEGYTTPTPIQLQAIPPVMEGRDLVGIAQTGTGKTAAFALPILHKLAESNIRPLPRAVRTLILCPTRELAGQIGESFGTYGRYLRLSRAVVFGGVSLGNQMRVLERGVDVLVATPGRLIDLLERRAVTLNAVEILVLDEADHMLDLGFIHAIRRVVKMLPKERQNLFFSATMPEAISGLANDILRDPVRVSVTPVAKTADKIEQHVIFTEQRTKTELLIRLTAELGIERGLVFSRTKHGADKIVKLLSAAGIETAAIHGNKSQNAREKALKDFKDGKLQLLIATDIAARGIDVDGLTHVVNYDLPDVPEAYVHRIGRTARAGASGIAVAFCAADEITSLRAIEKLTKKPIPVMEHALGQPEPAASGNAAQAARRGGGGRPQQGRPQGGRPQGGRPQGDRQQQGRQQNGRSEGGRPEGGRSEFGNAFADRFNALDRAPRPQGERSASGRFDPLREDRRPRSDAVPADRSAGDRPRPPRGGAPERNRFGSGFSQPPAKAR